MAIPTRLAMTLFEALLMFAGRTRVAPRKYCSRTSEPRQCTSKLRDLGSARARTYASSKSAESATAAERASARTSRLAVCADATNTLARAKPVSVIKARRGFNVGSFGAKRRSRGRATVPVEGLPEAVARAGDSSHENCIA